MAASHQHNNITFKDDLLKAELQESIKQHKPQYQSHIVTDKTVWGKGFNVIRLPLHNFQLNLIKFI
jgi:hypothetical protein